MLEDKEKKMDEKVDAKPASEKKESQHTKEGDYIYKLTQIFKSAEDVIDEMLVEGSTPSIAILGLIIASFHKNMQDKILAILKRDPVFKTVSDRVDAENKAKCKEEAAE